MDGTVGHYSEKRKPYRTLVRVEAVEQGDRGGLARVYVPAWSVRNAVTVHAEQIVADTGVSMADLPGRRFLADVNIHASSGDDLRAVNFETLAPPSEYWMRKRLRELEFSKAQSEGRRRIMEARRPN